MVANIIPITPIPLPSTCTFCTILCDGSVESKPKPVIKRGSGTKTGQQLFRGHPFSDQGCGVQWGAVKQLDATDKGPEGEL